MRLCEKPVKTFTSVALMEHHGGVFIVQDGGRIKSKNSIFTLSDVLVLNHLGILDNKKIYVSNSRIKLAEELVTENEIIEGLSVLFGNSGDSVAEGDNGNIADNELE
eukprot:GHVP01070957.1.p1 GENE.GHVP01070957.1~~GHVP01070957.1.p1  ORF type:complete len:114 (+),score=22.03 GHVP01070957.1:23-343(+)